MPYQHTKRPTGTVLTYQIYNADHENHITYGEAAYLGGASSTIAQLQTILSPGDVGSEVVPETVADYIQELRYVLKNMTNGTYWYQKTGSRTMPVEVHADDYGANGVFYGFTINGNAPARYISVWPVSDDYASGDVTVSWWVSNSAGSGNVRYTKAYGSLETGNSWQGGTVEEVTIARANTNTHAITITVPAASVPDPGTGLITALCRFPAHAEDTSLGNEPLYGVTVTYTAYIGR